jgi:DNA-binding CsgD family transcriptional regulator
MSEVTKLFTRDDDFRNQTADLIHISRTLPPNLKDAFADKTEHFSEYEFGYYADLSSAKNAGEFKNKIHTIVQSFGFSDFSFVRMHCGDIDSKLLVTGPDEMLSAYFDQNFMKYDMILPYTEQGLEPIFLSKIREYVSNSPFETETTRVMKSIYELNKSYGFYDYYNIPIKALNGEGNVLFSVTIGGYSPTEIKRAVDESKVALLLLCEAIDFVVTHKFSDDLIGERVATPEGIAINPRPLRVLQALANNDFNIMQVAEHLNISAVTANKHLETARKALGVRTNYAAIKKGILNGLINYEK